MKYKEGHLLKRQYICHRSIFALSEVGHVNCTSHFDFMNAPVMGKRPGEVESSHYTLVIAMENKI